MKIRPRWALPLAIALSACASGAQRGSPGIVQPEDLPPRQREVLEAWRAGGSTWESFRGRLEADPELSRFLVDNLVLQMVRSFDRAAIGSAFRPESPFQRAQDELVRMQAVSLPLLSEMLLVRDDIVAFLCADTLKRIGAPASLPVAEKLGTGGPEVRRRVAELLESLPESPSGEPAILEKLGRAVEADEAWIVRAQAARSLGARGARRKERGYAAAVLGRALADPEPLVRKTALEALGALGQASAVPALIRALERAALDGDLPSVRAAQAGLRRLTGETRDLDPEEWWEKWARR